MIKEAIIASFQSQRVISSGINIPGTRDIFDEATEKLETAVEQVMTPGKEPEEIARVKKELQFANSGHITILYYILHMSIVFRMLCCCAAIGNWKQEQFFGREKPTEVGLLSFLPIT